MNNSKAALIGWSELDQQYLAQIPGSTYLVIGGPSAQEALNNAEELSRLMAEHAKKEESMTTENTEIPAFDYFTTREVTVAECTWLSEDVPAGTKLHRYSGCTYGCISPAGQAVSLDGKTPFFELPITALGEYLQV